MVSHLLTQRTIGLPLRCSMAAISLSVATTPERRSVTSTITSAASIASWACVRICARITSFVFGSMPPVSTRENLRLRHSLSP